MAQIMLSLEDLSTREDLLAEMDPDQHELLKPFADRMSSDDWAFLSGLLREDLVALIDHWIAVKAFVEFGRERGILNDDGVQNLMTSTSFALPNAGLVLPAWISGRDRYVDIVDRFHDHASDSNPLLDARDGLVDQAEQWILGDLRVEADTSL